MGEIELARPLDLSQRGLFRVIIDNRAPLDIPVAGISPLATSPEEIVSALNAAIPGLASLSEEQKLVLRSPSAGEESHIAVAPMRALELIDYPAASKVQEFTDVPHGSAITLENVGASASQLTLAFQSQKGLFGLGLVDLASEQAVRVQRSIRNGEIVSLYQTEEGELKGEIQKADGNETTIDAADISVGPIGVHANIPFDSPWDMAGTHTRVPSIHLNNPATSTLTTLRQRSDAPGKISVMVKRSNKFDCASLASGDCVLSARLVMDGDQFKLIDEDDNLCAWLTLAQSMDLYPHVGHVVRAEGTCFIDADPVLLADQVFSLYDVEIASSDPSTTKETYEGVTIGSGDSVSHGLNWQVNIGPEKSALIKAAAFNKSDFLALPRGRSEWVFMTCQVARFNDAYFNEDHFAGGICYETGVFNASRFSNAPPENIAAVFGDQSKPAGETTDITGPWQQHNPGEFAVNLPVDLNERYGGKFNESRFSIPMGPQSLFENVVSEPESDPQHFINLIGDSGSALVTAEVVPTVPLGWSAIEMPFRKSQFLTLGDENQAARLYLLEDDVPGFIKLEAKEKGVQGNKIYVTARKSGPAQFDVTIAFEGGKFEQAKAIAAGDAVPLLSAELMKPAQVGVLQAKAGGIRTTVTRK